MVDCHACVLCDLPRSDLGYVNADELKEACIEQPNSTVSYEEFDLTEDGATQCFYLAYLRKYVFLPAGMLESGFRKTARPYLACHSTSPPKGVNPIFWGKASPTYNDTYRHHIMQGQVR